jgi:hypothetical protein
LLLSLSLAASGVTAAAKQPAVTPSQIEADWDRQDTVRHAPASTGGNVTPAQDAAGGCDGAKTGEWGFHTAHQKHPWWQVDLGEAIRLERVVLYNRCQSGMAERAARIIVLLSHDGHQFTAAYQHDGTTFWGKSGGEPLTVRLDGRRARFVRVQLPRTDYLHLDEVEVYSTGSQHNVALHRPATQSSTSQWSVVHESGDGHSQAVVPDQVLRRGRQLAENLQQLGADVEGELASLEQVSQDFRRLPDGATEVARRGLIRRARWAVRKMALKNPLLDFDEILFIKRAPGLFPHVSDQYYGWWSRGGGGIYILSGFKGDQPTVRCLTEEWPEGSFLRPDLSYDGQRVLFAWCRHYPHVAAMEKVDKEQLPEDAFYHLFEMNLDGSGLRQLTHGYYDDFDGRYLPNGDIVFLSTRKGQALQGSRQTAQATVEATCPDSYVRCGGDNHRPVAVFTMHVIKSDGTNLRPISAFENFEWTPAVASDGRILYARWDYIDRFNGHFMSLWSTNPDGTNAQLVYGNYTTSPQCIFEAQPIPNSQKLVFTATAHHSITGGSLALLAPNRGTEAERPVVRLTPEVVYPEAEGWPTSYYAGPHPLSEQFFLVSWSDRPLPQHRLMPPDDPGNPRNALGLYLFDALGNLTLLHRDPDISSMNPIPIRPRPRPPRLADRMAWQGNQEGRFLLLDVYAGLPGVERGEIKQLRVVAVPPKVQPHMNQPVLGVSAEDPGKFVLGTVPVEPDGSAYFRVPSGVPVLFQALDQQGMALQTMRSLTYLQPNQTLSCIGCHESRCTAPAVDTVPLAAQRPPSRLRSGPNGSWPLRFDHLVQPVLDRQCVTCHRPDCDDQLAARFDLTSTHAYENLLQFANGDLRNLALERDRSNVGECVAHNSKLLHLLTDGDGHYNVQLTVDDLDRLVTWMDTYAQRLGSFGPAQEAELRAFRRRLAYLLEEPDQP